MTKRTANPWTAEEDATLRSVYLSHSYADIAVMLGRTVGMVRTHRYNLGLPRKIAKWTEDEVLALRKSYEQCEGASVSPEEIARDMGRSYASVALKASKLGLGDCARQKSDAQRTAISKRMEVQWKVLPHPRGALGMKHSEETRRVLGEKSKADWMRRTPEETHAMSAKAIATKIELYGTGNPGMLTQSNPYSRAKSGKREDLGIFVRSSWEANYCRYLNWLKDQGQIKDWQYEAQTFVFHGVTRGVLTYTPDFKVIEMDDSYCWHEVKGWMDDRSKAKLKRMAKFYPNEKIIVIGADEYKALAKWKALIPEWETVKP